MPNWCENNLVVTGSKKELENFDKKFIGCYARFADEKDFEFECIMNDKEISEDEKLIKLRENSDRKNAYYENKQHCLNALYPVPKDILKKGYNDAGYDWCVAYWGTKWDIEVLTSSNSDTMYCYKYSTAWTPNLEWVEYVSKQFPELKFELKYYEPGMAFAGITEYKNGKILYEHTTDYREEDYDEFLVNIIGVDIEDECYNPLNDWEE